MFTVSLPRFLSYSTGFPAFGSWSNFYYWVSALVSQPLHSSVCLFNPGGYSLSCVLTALMMDLRKIDLFSSVHSTFPLLVWSCALQPHVEQEIHLFSRWGCIFCMLKRKFYLVYKLIIKELSMWILNILLGIFYGKIILLTLKKHVRMVHYEKI